MAKRLKDARRAWETEKSTNPIRTDGANDKINRFVAEDLIEAQDHKITRLEKKLKRWQFIATHDRAFMVGCGEGAAPRSTQNVEWLGELYDEVHAEA